MTRKGDRQRLQENTEVDTEDKNYDDYSTSEEKNDQDAITDYDITATPNDFNILTIYQFIESKTIKIPGFQRNYVWDIKRASKLIESLIVGLPILKGTLSEMVY
ncbi:DUF262 domain-containing protein [Chloroflexota bacterium]